MKSIFSLSIAILLAMVVAPCSASVFKFEEEEEGPVLTERFSFKCSLEGFYSSKSTEEQMALIAEHLAENALLQSDPVPVSDTVEDVEQEGLFLSNSTGSSPIFADEPPFKMRIGDDGLALLNLDPSYPSDRRRYDLADFPADPLGFYLEAVLDPIQSLECLLFFKNLSSKLGRTTPDGQCLNHPNFLAWKLISTTEDPLPLTYLTAIMKDNMVHFADLNAFTTSPNPSLPLVRDVISAFGMMMESFCRETRTHRLKAYQFEVAEDNALMKAVVQGLDLRLYEKSTVVGLRCPSNNKRSFLELKEGVGRKFYRYYKAIDNPDAFREWYSRESKDSDE